MNKTFIVGADSNHQAFIPWWFNNVKKHDTKTHITFADFGITKEARLWVDKHADCVLDYPKKYSISWFHKPQTLIDAPYEYKCWIDIDCEVLTNISEIFDFVDGTNIAVTEDPCRRKDYKGEKWLATGVNVVKDKPNILKLWAEKCKKTYLRGDQEVLHEILKKDNWLDFIVEMPPEYQWLRIQLARGQNHPNKKIIHWTGPDGKRIISEKCGVQKTIKVV